MNIHKDLTPEKWFSFSLMEQLANIGMDIDRTIRWRNKGNFEYSKNAFDRALELLYYCIEDPKNRGHRLRELLRVREALVDYFLCDNEYGSTDKLWQNYFLNFNYIAALEKGK